MISRAGDSPGARRLRALREVGRDFADHIAIPRHACIVAGFPRMCISTTAALCRATTPAHTGVERHRTDIVDNCRAGREGVLRHHRLAGVN